MVILQKGIKIIVMNLNRTRKFALFILFIFLSGLLITSCIHQDKQSNEYLTPTITPNLEQVKTVTLTKVISNTPEPVKDEIIMVSNFTVKGPLPDSFLSLLGDVYDGDLEDGSAVEIGFWNEESQSDGIIWQGQWVYTIVTSFSQIEDVISFREVNDIWYGNQDDLTQFQRIYMTSETYEVFSFLWGKPGDNIVIVEEDGLTSHLWTDNKGCGLIPFERIAPLQKVLTLDGINVLEKGIDLTNYPLTLVIQAGYDDELGEIDPKVVKILQDLPSSNRDEALLTNVLMTGVTALVRGTGEQMLSKGIDYPYQDISDWFFTADIAHISNEVSFFTDCLSMGATWSKSRFCSPVGFFDLIKNLEIDVVELTGNHLLDYGEIAFKETLALYESNNIVYYGGGYDQNHARAPLLVENNGNRIAFIGCNVPGPENVFATTASSGAARCDMEWLTNEIRQLKTEGYLVIVTFQHYESCQYLPMSGQRVDFNSAAEAGADIVSGSQAHCAQTMTFLENSFVHYGLGNLFFDQMWKNYRSQFLDLHTFYNGKYINTRLLTTILEDSAKPRPMTAEERDEFITKIFNAGGWLTNE